MTVIQERGFVGLPKFNHNSGPRCMVHYRFTTKGNAMQWLIVEGQLEGDKWRFWGVICDGTDTHWSYFSLADIHQANGQQDPQFVPVLLDDVMTTMWSLHDPDIGPVVVDSVSIPKGQSSMSSAAGINSVIAYIENRPELFKELLRAPSSGVHDVSQMQQRLQQALKRYAATHIRTGLMQTLHVAPDEDTPCTMDPTFYEGVRAVEKVFEALAEALES